MASMGEYYYLSKKSWRALIYNFDALDDIPDGSALYCLTNKQAAWLLANCSYYAWKTRWDIPPDQINQAILNQEQAELEYNLMTCFDMSWLEQLQYLFDRTVDEQLELFSEQYGIGGIPDINADSPTTIYNDDDSPDRINALCFACDTYVRTIINAWAEKLRLAQTALDFSAFAVSFVPYIGRIAAVAVKALSIVTQVAVNAANDDTAIEEVVCCMFNGLYGNSVNQANFELSLNSCDFIPGSNAAILRDIIAADLDNFENWLSFMNTLGDCWVYLQAGITYDCACLPDPVTFEQEIIMGTLGTTSLFTVDWGNTNTVRTITTLNAGIQSFQISIPIPSPRVLTKVIVETSRDGSTQSPFQRIRTYESAVQQESVQSVPSVGYTADTLNLSSLSTIDNVLFFMRAGTTAGSAQVRKITIFGYGTNPF